MTMLIQAKNDRVQQKEEELRTTNKRCTKECNGDDSQC